MERASEILEDIRYDKLESDTRDELSVYPAVNTSSLPIHRYKDSILYSLEKATTLIVIGETGCGKSTRI